MNTIKRLSFAMTVLLGGVSIINTGEGVRAHPGHECGDAKKAEEEIKQAFVSLQAAIKKKDPEKIWDLLAKESRGDAEKRANLVKKAYNKAADKAFFEKRYALTSKDLADMTGKLFVKSKVFFDGETDEMPDSRLDKVVVSGEMGTVHYTEEAGKGGKEVREVVREGGQWRFVLPVPKAVLK